MARRHATGAPAHYHLAMLKRLLGMFRGRPLLIPGTDKLAEGEARKVDIGDVGAGGTQIVLCRLDGQVYAVDTLCPHEGGRIQPGPMVDGKFVTCPLHNYTFDPRDGSVVRGSCKRAKTYRVEERPEGCEVWL